MRNNKLSLLLSTLAALAVTGCADGNRRPDGPGTRDSMNAAQAGSNLYVPLAASNYRLGLQAGDDIFTGLQVQNLSQTESTDVVLKYFNLDGSAHSQTAAVSLGPGESETFIQRRPASEGGVGSAAWAGSVVVEGSSLAQLGATLNVVRAPTAARGDAYEAVAEPKRFWTVPMIDLRQDALSVLAVQNATDSPTTVTLTYGDGSVRTESLAARETKHINAAASRDLSPLGIADDGRRPVSSATVEATGDVVVAMIANRGTQTMNAYTAAEPGSTLAPLVNFQGNIDTFLYGQNGGGHGDVTVTYISTDGEECRETVKDLAPYETASFGWSFHDRAEGDHEQRLSTCTALSGSDTFVGSATVNGDATLVALQQTGGLGSSGGIESSYAGARQGLDVGSKIAFPLLQANNNGWFSGFAILNTSPFHTTVTCSFNSTDGTTSADTFQIPGGGTAIDVQRQRFDEKFVGSASCRSNNTALLAGVANQFKPGSGLLTYRASPIRGDALTLSQPSVAVTQHIEDFDVDTMCTDQMLPFGWSCTGTSGAILKAMLQGLRLSSNVEPPTSFAGESWDNWVDSKEYRGYSRLGAWDLYCNDDGTVAGYTTPIHEGSSGYTKTAVFQSAEPYVATEEGGDDELYSRYWVERDSTCVTHREQMSSRLTEVERWGQYTALGFDAPFVWRELSTTSCCDGSFFVDVDQSQFPNTYLYVDEEREREAAGQKLGEFMRMAGDFFHSEGFGPLAPVHDTPLSFP